MDQVEEIREIEPRKNPQLREKHYKYVLIGAIFAGMLLIIALLTAVFAMKSAKEAQHKADTLTEELSAAFDQIAAMQQRYNALEESYTKLQGDFDSLKAEHAELQNQYQELEKAYKELEDAYNLLVEENNQLKTEAEEQALEEREEEIHSFEAMMCGYYQPETVMGMSMSMANIVYKLQGGKGNLEDLFGLELKTDSKGIFYNEGTPVEITWYMEGDTLMLETDEFYSEATYEDGRIYIVVEDMDVVLVKVEN